MSDEVKISHVNQILKETNTNSTPYPKSFFKLPTTMSFVGPRGSGKTYNGTVFMKWMIEHGYFTRVYIISPTMESNGFIFENIPVRPGDVYSDPKGGWEAIKDIVRKVLADVKLYLDMQKYKKAYAYMKEVTWMGLTKEKKDFLLEQQDKIQTFYEEFLEAMEEVLVPCPANDQILGGMVFPRSKLVHMAAAKDGDENDEWVEEEPDDEEMEEYLFPPPTLPQPVPVLFVDDMSHTSLYSPSPDNPMINFVLRHRHLGGKGFGVTLMFALQTFKAGLQKSLRANTMQFVMFRSNDTGLIRTLYEELGAFTTYEEFVDMYHRAIREGDEHMHDFMVIDLNPTFSARVFRRGWDTILIRRPMIQGISTKKSRSKKKKVEIEEAQEERVGYLETPMT